MKISKMEISRLSLAVLLACFLAMVPETTADYAVENLTLGGANSSVPWWEEPFNSQGQVIGTSDLPDGSSRVFFHDGTAIHELGCSRAVDLNDAGQVLCQTSNAETPVWTAYLWSQAGGIVDLGSLGDNTHTFGNDLNGSGQVVGMSLNNDGKNHAYIWTEEEGMRDLGAFEIGISNEYSNAYGINEAGQVYGTSGTDPRGTSVFLWTEADEMLSLGTLGGLYSFPTEQNESGQVIGRSTISPREWRPFMCSKESGMVEIGPLGGSNYSYPNFINESGQVAGSSNSIGFVWTAEDGIVNIGTLGGEYSYPWRGNESGQVVGTSYNADGETRCFIWSRETGIRGLGTLGGTYADVWDINEAGQVVGQSTTADEEYHAFLWTEAEGMVDLNDLIISTAPAGLVLEGAVAISENGKIVAESNAGLVLLSASSAAPTIGPISLDNDPAAAGVAISAGVSFLDENTSDTHTAEWNWGDGSPVETGTISENDGSGTVSGSHSYAEAGIYSVSVKVTDNTGLSAAAAKTVVVYDPSAGFVTGGGWIHSPRGAYKENEMLSGKASFGFVSKYKKGASTPTGNTNFRFHAGDLSFYSDSYDWLVIAGSKAMYKGEGSINGEGSYKFILTAIDADLNKNDSFPVDRFRIKIWYYDAELEEEVTVYDNQIEEVDEDSQNEGTELRGGSIKIHKK